MRFYPYIVKDPNIKGNPDLSDLEEFGMELLDKAVDEVPKELINLLFTKLPKSLSLTPAYGTDRKHFSELEDLYSRGFNTVKNGKSWNHREIYWYKDTKYVLSMYVGVLFIAEVGAFYDTTFKERDELGHTLDMLPIFPNYGVDVVSLLNNKTQETTEMKNDMKSIFNRQIDANKSAAKLSAKLSVGRTANQVLTSRLASMFPWYAKLFGKHKEMANNPFLRLGTSQAIYAAVQHFSPENEKLQFVAEAMLDEAMVDATYNSEQLKAIIAELEKVGENAFSMDMFATKTSKGQ